MALGAEGERPRPIKAERLCSAQKVCAGQTRQTNWFEQEHVPSGPFALAQPTSALMQCPAMRVGDRCVFADGQAGREARSGQAGRLAGKQASREL